MNRLFCMRTTVTSRIPRIRGDEPNAALVKNWKNGVFPASAGMNRNKG